MRAELASAYDCWSDCEDELQAGLQAQQDMLDEEVEANWTLTQMLADSETENWELAEFLAKVLAEKSVLSRQVEEQQVVIAELNAQLATTRRQVL